MQVLDRAMRARGQWFCCKSLMCKVVRWWLLSWVPGVPGTVNMACESWAVCGHTREVTSCVEFAQCFVLCFCSRWSQARDRLRGLERERRLQFVLDLSVSVCCKALSFCRRPSLMSLCSYFSGASRPFGSFSIVGGMHKYARSCVCACLRSEY